MTTLTKLKKDYLRYSRSEVSSIRIIRLAFAKPGFRAMCCYRLGHALRKKNFPLLAGLCQRIMHHFCHCYISVSAEIGPGFLIAHVGGIVIGSKTIIGSNCDIRQNVTLGGNYNRKDDEGRSQPVLGDGVSIGAGACILGPVKVGANSIVGANSVVTRDVPEMMIVFGIPGRVLKEVWDCNSKRKL